jgi:hypothetical protein
MQDFSRQFLRALTVAASGVATVHVVGYQTLHGYLPVICTVLQYPLSNTDFLVLGIAYATSSVPHGNGLGSSRIYLPEEILAGPFIPRSAVDTATPPHTLEDHARQIPAALATDNTNGYNQDWSPWVCYYFFRSRSLNIPLLVAYDRVQWVPPGRDGGCLSMAREDDSLQ